MASPLMKPLRWLLADPAPAERRTVDPLTAWLRDDSSGATTSAGVRVTQGNALAIGAVFSAVTLISDTVAMLPASTYVKQGEYRMPAPTEPDWLEYPDPDGLIWFTFMQQWIVSKLISHGACTRILRDPLGDVLGFKVLDPRKVNPDRERRTGNVVYDYGGRTTIAARDMIYDSTLIPPGQVKGISRIDELKEMFGLAKALEQFSARFFGQGSTTSGVLAFPGEGDKALAEQIQDNFEAGHRGLRNAHRPGVVFGGGTFTKTGVDPEEAQMLESREFSVEEVARVFRIHPSMLQVTKPGVQGFASREQDAIQYTTFTLMSYLTPIEQHLNRVLPAREFIKIKPDGLLRASLTDRYAAYNQGIQGGFLTINRINALEDQPPVEGGDVYRVPLANIDLGAANLVELQKRVDMFVSLVAEGADPASATAAVGLPPITFTTTAPDGPGARDLNLVEAVQKVYLGVGTVITSDEARQMLNDAGANLAIPGPDLGSTGGAAA